jgi:hypothetical protein
MTAFGYGDPYKHVLGFVSCLANTADQFGEYHRSSRRHNAINIADRRLPLCALKGRDSVVYYVVVPDSSALATRL